VDTNVLDKTHMIDDKLLILTVKYYKKKKALLGIFILTFITNVGLIFSIVAYGWKMSGNKTSIPGVL
jgi:hypothetical protein